MSALEFWISCDRWPSADRVADVAQRNLERIVARPRFTMLAASSSPSGVMRVFAELDLTEHETWFVEANGEPICAITLVNLPGDESPGSGSFSFISVEAARSPEGKVWTLALAAAFSSECGAAVENARTHTVYPLTEFGAHLQLTPTAVTFEEAEARLSGLSVFGPILSR